MASKANKKAMAKVKDKMVEDKTFGLKNKKKSKVVQKHIAAVTCGIKGQAMAAAERAKQEKKNAKVAKMQQEEEMRALFGEALDGGKKAQEKSKKDQQKAQAAALKKSEETSAKVLKDYPFIADEMLASTGMLNDMSPEEMAEELASFMKTGTSEKLTLEQVIELQRAKMRSDGTAGTPVTEESLAAWKARRAEKRRLEAHAKVEAELKKKKGGKGLSVLSGKELFAYNQQLFVDDDDADNDEYERRSDAGSSDDESSSDEEDAPAARPNGGGAAEEEAPENPLAAGGEPMAVAMQESLYLEGDDDDLDDLDDLSDDE